MLVTGGMGFIGSNFIRYIVENKKDDEQEVKFPIINVDNLSYGSHPDNLKGIDETKHKFIYADITDKEKIEEIIKQHKPEIIINFAAQSHVDRSIKDPTQFVKTNVLGTLNLLEAARKYDTRFIQIGTDEEYGEIEKGSFTENDKLTPSSPYSASKASATLLTLSYVKTYSLDAIVTRTSNNFGPRQYPEKLIPKTIIRTLLNLPIPVYGTGKNVRDWIYVEDNCEAIYTVAKKGKKGEIYNISANQEKTNLEIIKEVVKIMNKEEKIKFVEDRPGHDIRYSINSQKIRGLGWEPKHTFQEALKKTVEWYIQNEWWWKKILTPEVIAETPWK
ncbi:dTDP-glucose 4,6-dehydratase [Acidianus manzaensis]|uniref:dTDP-glucose 4,6-dehydratase n=2 Tax=Acidianus manzaensis TaxID=282676 RepID=A0A1W6K376_9CREN|nr:dTDP-glucose 4,6-dehydratase [Acidianus manzaensis]